MQNIYLRIALPAKANNLGLFNWKQPIWRFTKLWSKFCEKKPHNIPWYCFESAPFLAFKVMIKELLTVLNYGSARSLKYTLVVYCYNYYSNFLIHIRKYFMLNVSLCKICYYHNIFLVTKPSMPHKCVNFNHCSSLTSKSLLLFKQQSAGHQPQVCV